MMWCFETRAIMNMSQNNSVKFVGMDQMAKILFQAGVWVSLFTTASIISLVYTKPSLQKVFEVLSQKI
jgi:hypothetical protein